MWTRPSKLRASAPCFCAAAAVLNVLPSGLVAETDARPSDPVEMIAETPEVSPLGLPCGLSLSATPGPAAMVALDIMSPCQPETTVRIEHSGLTITAATDALGLLVLDIPAFETPAFFTVRTEDGTSESLLVPVPDVTDYDRVGLSWTAPAEMALHAMEFGAAFGEAGHVWRENPRSVDMALSEEGGFLTVLGGSDAPGMTQVEIYTFPRARLVDGDRDGVALSMDAAITEENCGQPATAHTLQAQPDGRVDVTPLTFNHPDCESVGEYLVLQNLLGALTVASN